MSKNEAGSAPPRRSTMRAIAGRSLPLLLLAATATAGAHEASSAADGGWRMEPWIVVLLLAAALLYARGVLVLWRQAGRWRGVGRLHTAAFATGWLVTLIALAPPVDPLAQRLFSMHMVQHELLMAVAAPLLVLGQPFVAWSWAWPGGARRLHRAFSVPWLASLWRRLTEPLGAWLLHAAAVWLWHMPRLHEAALAHPLMHELQHVSFFGSALLFWWSVLPRRAAQQGPALVSIFTTMLHTGVLGALLVVSTRTWYPSYGPATLALGIDPLADQHLGGLLMWVPAGMAYLVAGLAVAASLLTDDKTAARPRAARP